MRDHEGCEFIVCDDLFGEVDEKVRASGIESSSVLVEQQEFGTQPRGHEKSEGLALTTGETADGIFEAVFQAHV
jgi:hypothetical protein